MSSLTATLRNIFNIILTPKNTRALRQILHMKTAVLYDLTYSFTVWMEAIFSTETSAVNYQSRQSRIL